jgi:hypothetical protein
LPASAYSDATIGALALVRPTIPHPLKHCPSHWLNKLQLLWYTATPVFESATADTSATVRRAQPPSVC